MLKRPFEYITDYLKDKSQRDKKNNEFIFSQTDSLISWIIGFAFSGLLLLIGNIKNLELTLRTPTKPVIICIFLTILLGLFFRYVSFLIIMFEKNLDDYYFGLFGEHEMTPFEVSDEIENADFDKILIFLKDDFNETINYSHPITDALKAHELPMLKEHYKNLCEHSKKSLEVAMNHIFEIEYTTHRIDKKKNYEAYITALKNPKVGYNAHRWSILRSSLFTLCLLSFLTGISVVCFSLLFMR